MASLSHHQDQLRVNKHKQLLVCSDEGHILLGLPQILTLVYVMPLRIFTFFTVKDHCRTKELTIMIEEMTIKMEKRKKKQ